MNGSPFITQIVGYRDLNHITPIRLDHGSRKFSINKNDRALDAIWCDIIVRNGKIVITSYTSRWGFRVRVCVAGVLVTPRVGATIIVSNPGWKLRGMEGTQRRPAIGLALWQIVVAGGNESRSPGMLRDV